MLMRALAILGLCIGAAFICAFVFVAMLQLSLPLSDGAYGIPFPRIFSDPFVLWVSISGAIVVGLISFPFAYFTIRKLRLLTTTLFVFGVVLGEIVLVTPFWAWLGLYGSIPVLAGALLVCRFSGWRIFVRTV